MERVTVDSVRTMLAAGGAAHGRVSEQRPGVVRIEFRAVPRAVRRVRRQAILDSLESRRHEELWLVRPAGTTYRWRPWVTWVTVRDPGLDWIDPATGLDFITMLAQNQRAAG